MTAASLGRSPVRGLDRLVLTTGLALVGWSRRRAARRATVVPVGSVRPGSRTHGLRERDLADLGFREIDRPRGYADPSSVESLLLAQGVQHTFFR